MTAAPDARILTQSPVRRPALPSLTGLRFVAATMVFFFHVSFWDPPQNPFADRSIGDAYQTAFSKAGWMGVSFFFSSAGSFSPGPGDRSPEQSSGDGGQRRSSPRTS